MIIVAPKGKTIGDVFDAVEEKTASRMKTRFAAVNGPFTRHGHIFVCVLCGDGCIAPYNNQEPRVFQSIGCPDCIDDSADEAFKAYLAASRE